MLAWMIGCVEHGLSEESVNRAKDSILKLNLMTCKLDGKDIFSGAYVTGDENYHAPDFCASTATHFGYRKGNTCKEYIWLITSGSKVQNTHESAIDVLKSTGCLIPVKVDYEDFKMNAFNFIYSCNGEKTHYNGWGSHTRDRIGEAWNILESISHKYDQKNSDCFICKHCSRV